MKVKDNEYAFDLILLNTEASFLMKHEKGVRNLLDNLIFYNVLLVRRCFVYLFMVFNSLH